MAASKDRVTFYLPYRYFTSQHTTNGMTKETCMRVLNASFGMSASEMEGLMFANPSGFTIVCRPSQFARFIVFRDQADECINGIRDLCLKLGPAEVDKPKLLHAAVADSLALPRSYASDIIDKLRGLGVPVPAYVPQPDRADIIDVSGNFEKKHRAVGGSGGTAGGSSGPGGAAGSNVGW